MWYLLGYRCIYRQYLNHCDYKMRKKSLQPRSLINRHFDINMINKYRYFTHKNPLGLPANDIWNINVNEALSFNC